ncbi:MAG: hypothetical protein JOZ52_07860 [Acidobacteria bacterium]|nr:hypothetical protein [Acidobacteriota bacterium]
MATKAKAATKKSSKRAAKAPRSASQGDNQMYRTSKVYKSSKTVSVDELPPEYSRADLEFIGVDHSGPSYEARVYLNNPNADANTPATEEEGYAGSYHIFGHNGCYGDLGHCDVVTGQDEFDVRPSSPLQPIKKVVIATDAIKKAAAQSAKITVTVVPVIKSWSEKADLNDVLKFDHINLVTYD